MPENKAASIGAQPRQGFLFPWLNPFRAGGPSARCLTGIMTAFLFQVGDNVTFEIVLLR
jgi:hypothetical protein